MPTQAAWAQGGTQAAGHHTIGTFGAWTAAKHTANNRTEAAYAVSRPVTSEGKYTSRGPVYALVTYWPSGETTIHFEMGYTIKENGDVKVTLMNARGKVLKSFSFTPHQEEAWTPGNQDSEVIATAQNGATMIVEGISKRGTPTKDTYSLKGITQATKKAKDHIKSSPVKVERPKASATKQPAKASPVSKQPSPSPKTSKKTTPNIKSPKRS